MRPLQIPFTSPAHWTRTKQRYCGILTNIPVDKDTDLLSTNTFIDFEGVWQIVKDQHQIQILYILCKSPKDKRHSGKFAANDKQKQPTIKKNNFLCVVHNSVSVPEISAEWFMSGSRQQSPLFPRDYTEIQENKTSFHTECILIKSKTGSKKVYFQPKITHLLLFCQRHLFVDNISS